MKQQIKYKRQGDGRDSWEIKEYEGDVLVNAYMVYEDPTKPKKDKVDEFTPQEIAKLKQKLGL